MMLSSKSGQTVLKTQQMGASGRSASTSHTASEETDYGAVVGSQFGFAEAELVTESSQELRSRVSIAVTGFAPTDTDYLEEIGEDELPNVQTFAYVFGKRVFD